MWGGRCPRPRQLSRPVRLWRKWGCWTGKITILTSSLAVMRQLADEGMTMLVVTHEMGFAKNVSNKVVFMEHGVIVETSGSRDFFEHPRQERTKEFLQTISKSLDMAG